MRITPSIENPDLQTVKRKMGEILCQVFEVEYWADIVQMSDVWLQIDSWAV
jgi:hypothetical protein